MRRTKECVCEKGFDSYIKEKNGKERQKKQKVTYIDVWKTSDINHNYSVTLKDVLNEHDEVRRKANQYSPLARHE